MQDCQTHSGVYIRRFLSNQALQGTRGPSRPSKIRSPAHRRHRQELGIDPGPDATKFSTFNEENGQSNQHQQIKSSTNSQQEASIQVFEVAKMPTPQRSNLSSSEEKISRALSSARSLGPLESDFFRRKTHYD